MIEIRISGSKSRGEGMVEAQVMDVVKNMDSYEKLLLYAASAFGTDLKSKVKMQKLMFFCNYALPEVFEDTLYFEAYKKGPYSQDVEEYLLSLEDKNIIDLPSCAPTELGQKVSHYVIPKEPVKSIIDSYKKFICNLNQEELLTLIYVSFPEYQMNSEVWDDIKRNRLDVATSLMRKRVVSFSKAIEISGLDQDEFERHLISKRVRWRVV